MDILLQLIYSGVALGMIYAVIAFGYQLTFQTSDTLNFGQGDALMLGAMVGLTLVNMGVNYWVMLPIVIVFGLIQGGVVERIGVRPAAVLCALCSSYHASRHVCLSFGQSDRVPAQMMDARSGACAAMTRCVVC